MTSTADELTFEVPGPGVWLRDEDHWPRPVPDGYAEIYPPEPIPYVKEWTARYGLLLDHFETAFVNGFGYGRMRAVGEPEKGGSGPPPKPIFKALLLLHPELRARKKAARRALEERLWLEDLDRWDREAKPAVVAENRRHAEVDTAQLSDEALMEHVDACRESLRKFIGLHHRFNGAMIPVGLLMVAMQEWTGGADAALGLLQGASPVSSGRSDELDRLAAAIRADSTARAALDGDPAEAIERIASTGGDVETAWRDYVEVVGYRLVGDSIDHGNPTLIEVPELMLGAIRTAVAGDDRGIDDEEMAARTAAVRDTVPQEHRDEFDRLLRETRLTYRMRDERSVYGDVWAAGIFRQSLLELGRRLVDRGRLQEPVHLVEATSDEVAALAAGGGPSADELADRAAFRAEYASYDAPATLGGEPSDPPPLEWLPPALRKVNAAVLVQIEGFLDRAEGQGEEGTLRGTAASAGVHRGTAKVIRGPEQFNRIERDDVLVARTTSEAFNVVLPMLGAIVTDRGGALSHAAIVSREAGIPCVVGTGDATGRISDGSEVVVDGSEGLVKIG